MRVILTNYVLVLGWILAISAIMSGGIAIVGWLLHFFSGELNVWKELRKQNLAIGVILGGTMIAIGIMVGLLCK